MNGLPREVLLLPRYTNSAMTIPDDLFAEFPLVGKADWLRQIAQDLKDKPLEDLNWRLPNGLVVSPFVHADDFETPPAPLSEQPNQWEICEDVTVSDPVAANRQAMDALEGGAEGLCFWLDSPPSSEAFGRMLEGVQLDFIGLHFAGQAVADNPGMVLWMLENLARQRGIPTAQLRGSLAYDPVPTSRVVDWRYLADLLVFAKEKFPQFKIINISLSPTLEGAGLPAEGASGGLGFRNANLYLEKLSERGISAAEVAASIQFSVELGKSYFLEIARLRAFTLVWLNVLNAWELPLQMPSMAARFQPQAYADDLHTNMIRATTMAMSAVLGGAGRLTVLPYDAGRETLAKYPPAFARRIARNVQHLLKMESSLGEISDPAAGSYYVEALTRQLAEAAWGEFVRAV